MFRPLVNAVAGEWALAPAIAARMASLALKIRLIFELVYFWAFFIAHQIFQVQVELLIGTLEHLKIEGIDY